MRYIHFIYTKSVKGVYPHIIADKVHHVVKPVNEKSAIKKINRIHLKVLSEIHNADHNTARTIINNDRSFDSLRSDPFFKEAIVIDDNK